WWPPSSRPAPRSDGAAGAPEGRPAPRQRRRRAGPRPVDLEVNGVSPAGGIFDGGAHLVTGPGPNGQLGLLPKDAEAVAAPRAWSESRLKLAGAPTGGGAGAAHH